MYKLFFISMFALSFNLHAQELYSVGTAADYLNEYKIVDNTSYPLEALSSNIQVIDLSEDDYYGLLADVSLIAGFEVLSSDLSDERRKQFYTGALAGRVAKIYCDEKDVFGSLSPEKRDLLCSVGGAFLAAILQEAYDIAEGEEASLDDVKWTSVGGLFLGVRYTF